MFKEELLLAVWWGGGGAGGAEGAGGSINLRSDGEFLARLQVFCGVDKRSRAPPPGALVVSVRSGQDVGVSHTAAAERQ